MELRDIIEYATSIPGILIGWWLYDKITKDTGYSKIDQQNMWRRNKADNAKPPIRPMNKPLGKIFYEDTSKGYTKDDSKGYSK